MPIFKGITSFCHKSAINRVAEIFKLYYKNSSRQGAHITCQNTKKTFWHDDDKGVTNILKMPISEEIT